MSSIWTCKKDAAAMLKLPSLFDDILENFVVGEVKASPDPSPKRVSMWNVQNKTNPEHSFPAIILEMAGPSYIGFAVRDTNENKP